MPHPSPCDKPKRLVSHKVRSYLRPFTETKNTTILAHVSKHNQKNEIRVYIPGRFQSRHCGPSLMQVPSQHRPGTETGGSKEVRWLTPEHLGDQRYGATGVVCVVDMEGKEAGCAACAAKGGPGQPCEPPWS
jgi:hypothetical protein